MADPYSGNRLGWIKFRRLFLKALQAAHAAGRLSFFGNYIHLADAQCFAAFLAPLRKAEWVVFTKPPFGGPQAVLAYLSRYTHRVAISNRRLVALNDKGVSFKWKDYRLDGRERYKQGYVLDQALSILRPGALKNISLDDITDGRGFLVHATATHHPSHFAVPSASFSLARTRVDRHFVSDMRIVSRVVCANRSGSSCRWQYETGFLTGDSPRRSRSGWPGCVTPHDPPLRRWSALGIAARFLKSADGKPLATLALSSVVA